MAEPNRPTPAQLQDLFARDPRLGEVQERLAAYPGFPEKGGRPHFHALARIIIYQQLASGAAGTIHGRVRALSPDPRRFPTAEEILAIPEAALRDAGLSRNKLRAILDLAGAVRDGRLKLNSLHRSSEDEVLAQLTRVWGIGEWSAQMFLLFQLGRLDVFAPGDLGLREGIRILDGLEARPGPAEALERSRVWRPLRSVASWYLWRLADGGGV